MVTYGKTLGGGLPVGVVCGRADLMRRYREDRPADVALPLLDTAAGVLARA